MKGSIPLKLLFTSYHNKQISDEKLQSQNVVRVVGWKEVEKVLLRK